MPYEFPLYQWTVVAVSDLTGCSLVSAARGVTLFSFYAALPALAWLVRRYSRQRYAGIMTVLF